MIGRGLVLAGVIAVAMPSGAQAACANNANCSCTISSNGLNFGTYDQQSPSPTDSVGTVTVSCDSDDPGSSTFSISLNTGNSTNPSQRALRNGASELFYNLFTNASRSTIWGDGSGSGVTVSATFPPSNAAARPISIYGRIPARQNIAPGAYSDLVTVTITY